MIEVPTEPKGTTRMNLRRTLTAVGIAGAVATSGLLTAGSASAAPDTTDRASTVQAATQDAPTYAQCYYFSNGNWNGTTYNIPTGKVTHLAPHWKSCEVRQTFKSRFTGKTTVLWQGWITRRY